MLHVLGDILLVTSADESRRQIVVCPPVYAAGLAVSPCGVTSADERRRQIVVCPPFYAAGLAISPCGADHTPINHDVTEDPITVHGGHDEPQLPLQ